jgi:serine/threonine protein kinase
VSKAAKDLIKKLLQKLPQNRLTADEALRDAWIKQFHRGTNGANS